MAKAFQQRTYRAVRVEERRWDLHVDGVVRSGHRGYREAERAAEVDDRRRRTRRTAIRHTAILAGAAALLIPVLLLREVPNPDFAPARDFADRMEEAYRNVDGGSAAIDSFSIEADGYRGNVFEIDRGGVTADYRVLVGEYDGDCYVIRWVQDEVPFVARMLPRYPCEPGDPALSFVPSAFEEIAVNVSADGPLNWEPVLPAEVKLATWFFPATFALLLVVMQQLVSLSLLAIRGIPTRKVAVERVEMDPGG
jgi:hypothetical protein